MSTIKYNFKGAVTAPPTEAMKQEETPEESHMKMLTTARILGTPMPVAMARGIDFQGKQSPTNNVHAISFLETFVAQVLEQIKYNPFGEFPDAMLSLAALVDKDPSLKDNVFSGTNLVPPIYTQNLVFDFERVPAFLEWENSQGFRYRVFSTLVGPDADVYYILAVYKPATDAALPVTPMKAGFVVHVSYGDVIGSASSTILKWLLADPAVGEDYDGQETVLHYTEGSPKQLWRVMDHVN